jgi:hypothetical protein
LHDHGYCTRQREYRMGSGRKSSSLSRVRSRIVEEGEKETEVANARRTRDRIGKRIWNMPEVWARDFSPLDEELELLAGKLTPQGHEQLVRLSSYMPFEQAVELFEDFTGIHVNKDVGQRYTEEAGAMYEKLQAEEVEEIQKKRPKVRSMVGKLQVSADGCMVPLLHGVLGEVKTLVIGEVQPAILKTGERVVRTQNLSYFSRKTGSEEFERLSLGEMQRRGVENAKAVAALMDGVEWL